MTALSRKIFRYSLVVGLLCANEASWAQAYGAFSKDSIYGSLQHAEAVSFNEAAATVLGNPKDGVVTQWTSPVARRAPVSGQLYADGSRQQNGLPCRLLHARLEQGSNHENWEFWFCQTDGQWKAASQTRR
ncbi:hypothetical protein [Bordetella sp. BOR01]|uniref:hypothetical protein n=1 Tax=Bordetella sp. BOR01 TaxID=2854779 RepID=UPI001C445B7E|nr:hypothetical protein [Bordetella sp. BOR01]MBV7482429.1 hypothetical protein [Bordetella sp. BOR01]